MALPQGFGYKQFAEIKAEIEKSLVSSLGEINLSAPSVFATIVAIFAEREASLWEQIQAVYNSCHPQTAEGYSLDGICALNGVMRSSYTYSRAICQLTATPYTRIPKNSMAAVKNTLNFFALDEDLTVTNEKCYSVKIEIRNNSHSSYELTVNQQLLGFSKKGKGKVRDRDNGTINEAKEGIGDTEDIVAGMVSVINEANLGIEAVGSGSEISLRVVNFMDEFSCFVSEGIAILECTNNAQMTATEKGAIAAPVNSLRSIHTPISGWIACNNLTAAKIGNNQESDRDLRARREQSIKLGGTGTLEAIRAGLLNLNTVSAVSISENLTNRINEAGLPPHSFEALITGGEDQDIARLLWQKKPAGIRTHGRISVAVPDSEGKTQILSFSRPTRRFIYGKITVTRTKDFAEAAVEAVRAKLVSQINNLGVGSNVILKSLFLSIFSEQGIANACIELGSTTVETDRPDLREADVIIKADEVALTDAFKMEIILKDF